MHNGINLLHRGYAIISRRHRVATRIDRQDWDKTACRLWWWHTPQQRADLYRRLVSKDSVEVTASEMKMLPTSRLGPIGYLP